MKPTVKQEMWAYTITKSAQRAKMKRAVNKAKRKKAKLEIE